MEPWQCLVIKSNLPKLVQLTSCSTTLLAWLYSKDILTKEEVHEIEVIQNPIRKAYKLYDLLETRQNAYHLFIISCKETNQTGVAYILEDGERKHQLTKADESNVVPQSSHNTAFGSSKQQTVLRAELEKSFLKDIGENDGTLTSESDGPAIGINLGTTYCCVVAYFKGEVRKVKNNLGKSLTPIYVAFRDDDTKLFGELAKISAFRDPENTIFDLMRMIGRNWDDSNLQKDVKSWPFAVVNDGGSPKIKAKGKFFMPEQILAYLILQLQRDAEKNLGRKLEKAVLTVPSHFTNGQRRATKNAAKIAGLKVLEILNEPIAAAIAYKILSINDETKNVLMFDWGSKTLDVAVFEMSPNKIRGLAVNSDTTLGGESFDDALMRYCAKEFLNKEQVDVFAEINDTNPVIRLKARALLSRLHWNMEDPKKTLSVKSTTQINIDKFKNNIDLQVEVTREKFEEINDALFQKALDVVDEALAATKMGKKEIDDIVLVGGSSRIPKMQSMLKNHFGGKSLNHTILHDETMAYGAALRARMLLNGAKKSDGCKFEDSYIQNVTLF